MGKPTKEIADITFDKIHQYYNELDFLDSSHLFWMIDEIIKMKDERKANRWLGFIHGVLVSKTKCTIDELRNAIR